MRKFVQRPNVLVGVLGLALIAAACGSDSGDPGATGASGSEDLSGSITISGSSTVEPISSVVAEIFNESSPNVSITVDGPGTGDGFELFCNGETDISDASRPIDDDEVALCEENGIAYTELEVALDGLTVMTNPDNTGVTCLNDGDLYALFGPESDGIDTWDGADALAAEVGGNGGFPDAPLEITAPGEESGTYDAFIELSGIPDIAEAQGVPEDEWETLRQGLPGVAERQRDHHRDGGVARARSGSWGSPSPRRPVTPSRRSRSTAARAASRRARRRVSDGSYPLVAVTLHLREQRRGRASRRWPPTSTTT